MKHRPRILRRSEGLRDLVAETELRVNNLIYPLFVVEGRGIKSPIQTMPGQFRMSPDILLEHVGQAMDLGLTSFALFPGVEPSLKTSDAVEALNPKGLLPQVVRSLKKRYPQAVIITDVALDPYSSDGHDGLVRDGQVLNDESVRVLVQMALVQAEAGADMVAPSDMMDGRVGQIRMALEKNGFHQTAILAYSAKYASGFYGPFRDALDSAPKAGDKKTYQMDFRNRREALREAKLDLREGADILMVKPGLPYLDIIRDFANSFDVPIAAYNVSGEYAMVKAAAAQGMIDEAKVVAEILTSFRRAGASMILTYHAFDFATNEARQ